MAREIIIRSPKYKIILFKTIKGTEKRPITAYYKALSANGIRYSKIFRLNIKEYNKTLDMCRGDENAYWEGLEYV